jgi:Holliday junction resolvase
MNSKKKGNSFELKIAKMLSKTLNVKFTRTPNSGAFGTTHETQSLMGDIICPDNFKFVIECKVGYGLDFMSIFKKSKDRSFLLSFFVQVERDAQSKNKEPMVIYKKNNKPEWVFIHQEFLKEIPLNEYILIKGFIGFELEKLLNLVDKEFFFEKEKLI